MTKKPIINKWNHHFPLRNTPDSDRKHVGKGGIVLYHCRMLWMQTFQYHFLHYSRAISCNAGRFVTKYPKRFLFINSSDYILRPTLPSHFLSFKKTHEAGICSFKWKLAESTNYCTSLVEQNTGERWEEKSPCITAPLKLGPHMAAVCRL